MSACGSPLQPRGYHPHSPRGFLLCVREEPGELSTRQKKITQRKIFCIICIVCIYIYIYMVFKIYTFLNVF